MKSSSTVKRETNEEWLEGKRGRSGEQKPKSQDRKWEDGMEERKADKRQWDSIITTAFAWDYPCAQHTVKSLSFDILECLHKCIFERRKFCDSSPAIRLPPRSNHNQLLLGSKHGRANNEKQSSEVDSEELKL